MHPCDILTQGQVFIRPGGGIQERQVTQPIGYLCEVTVQDMESFSA